MLGDDELKYLRVNNLKLIRIDVKRTDVSIETFTFCFYSIGNILKQKKTDVLQQIKGQVKNDCLICFSV